MNQRTIFIILALILIYLKYFQNTLSISEGFACSICKQPPQFCSCDPNDWRVFKKPNYYGQGSWGYHYGEPFYYRQKQ